jgi:hypothetical protein
MQYVDGPAQIQALSEPARLGRVRTEPKALRSVTDPKHRSRIPLAPGRGRHLREEAAIGPPEQERPVGPTRRLVSLLVHRPVMPAAEQRQIRERGGAALRPVVEMVSLGDAHAATREATAPVPML